MTPVIHRRADPLHFESLDALSWQYFDTDWEGDSLPFQAGFHLALSPTQLQFVARCDIGPECDRSLSAGDFQEGLWQRDVAEMFVLNAQTGHYQEWNLSPIGAWWNQGFKAARKADPEHEIPTEVSAMGRILPGGGWVTMLSTPPLNEDQDWRLQISMIVQDMSGERRFLSVCPQPEIKPDFHRPQDWPEVEIR